jgi:hypothetical protein
VLAGDTPETLRAASETLRLADFPFSDVELFADRGLGVHGLPFHARHLLNEDFIFECGHSILEVSHYRTLIERKAEENVVFSAFDPHPSNPRQPVSLLADGRVAPQPNGGYALAHPFAVDMRYALNLPRLGYSINSIIEHNARVDRLRFVKSNFPPEFDVIQELEFARPIYEAALA